MTLILFIILFIILTILPFLISIQELIARKDIKPLYINMDYYKDPEYFSYAFKEMMESKISDISNELSNKNEIKLSKKETIEIYPSLTIPQKTVFKNLLYIKNDLRSERKVVFKKEIYVKGDVDIGINNVLRAVFCSGKLNIRKKTRLVRWAHSEKKITIDERASLGINISCSKKIEIGKKCQFISLYGKPILNKKGETKNCHPYDLSLVHNKKDNEYGRWFIIDKYLKVFAFITKKDDNKDSRSKIAKKRSENFVINNNTTKIPPNTTIKGDFITKNDLIIGSGCTIISDFKSYRGIKIGKNVKISGNVFAEDDIKISENCSINGNIFSQSSVIINDGFSLGSPEYLKSIIGKKRVILNNNFSVFGYIHTEGKGEIN